MRRWVKLRAGRGPKVPAVKEREKSADEACGSGHIEVGVGLTIAIREVNAAALRQDLQNEIKNTLIFCLEIDVSNPVRRHAASP